MKIIYFCSCVVVVMLFAKMPRVRTQQAPSRRQGTETPRPLASRVCEDTSFSVSRIIQKVVSVTGEGVTIEP
jgi:hypothetical protein